VPYHQILILLQSSLHLLPRRHHPRFSWFLAADYISHLNFLFSSFLYSHLSVFSVLTQIHSRTPVFSFAFNICTIPHRFPAADFTLLPRKCVTHLGWQDSHSITVGRVQSELGLSPEVHFLWLIALPPLNPIPSPPTVYCLLSTVHCQLSIVYCLLYAVCGLRSPISCSFDFVRRDWAPNSVSLCYESARGPLSSVLFITCHSLCPFFLLNSTLRGSRPYSPSSQQTK
jgi:hypothetical protein